MSDDLEWNKKIIEEFRANQGVVGGHFNGKTLLLLHTIGAKTGKEYVTPVAYVTDGACFAVIGSNSGESRHPAWYHNLLAHPFVDVEIGTERFQVKATIVDEPERTRWFDKMVEMMPVFDQYRRTTIARVIPVVVLARTHRA